MHHTCPLSCVVAGLLAFSALGSACAQAQPPAPAADTAAAQPRPPQDPEGIQGMWVWQERWVNDAQQRADLVAFCEKWGINRLLVQIHLDKAHDAPTIKYPEGLASLIAQAAEHGIAVEALDGAADMAMQANQARTMRILDTILAFNATLPEGKRFAGIHYDIEPYIMPEWKAGGEQRQVIMHDLLSYYQQVREKLDREAPDFVLAADIPFWYDSKTSGDDSCMIEFNGQRKNLHQHIQDLCDYIGIMSYRRHAVGSNSVVQHVQAELDYAEQIGKTVCPALETIELKDVPQITFFGTSPAEFWTQHNLVRETLNDRPGFGGMLTHSYRGLRDLLGQDQE